MIDETLVNHEGCLNAKCLVAIHEMRIIGCVVDNSHDFNCHVLDWFIQMTRYTLSTVLGSILLEHNFTHSIILQIDII